MPASAFASSQPASMLDALAPPLTRQARARVQAFASVATPAGTRIRRHGDDGGPGDDGSGAVPAARPEAEALALSRRWLAAADLHAQLGQPLQALAACREATRVAPAHLLAWLALARHCEAGADREGGAQAYAQAQRLAMPDDCPHEPSAAQWSRLRRVHQRMARHRMALGDLDGALACLQQALEAARFGGELADPRAAIVLDRVQAGAMAYGAPGRPRTGTPASHVIRAHQAVLAWLGDDGLEDGPDAGVPDTAVPPRQAATPARPVMPAGMVLGGVWLPVQPR